jgi:protein SCO1
MTTLPNPPNPPPARTSWYRWLIVVLGLLILLLVMYESAQDNPPVNASTELRKLSVVPPFALTERSGKTITNRDLSGKIWVADFIYTTCPGPCPMITASMAKIQEAVAHDPEVQLVSFSVDPDTDTPPVLAKYAELYGADPYRWWFLTGDEKQIYDLISNGFHVIVQDNSGQPPAPGQYKVTHSTNLVLVDGDGNVRGYYDGVDANRRANLLSDIKVLEKEDSQ